MTTQYLDCDMATEAKNLRVPRSTSPFPAASAAKDLPVQDRRPARVYKGGPIATGSCDVVLLHNGADASRAAKLGEALAGARVGNRNLRIVLADWKSAGDSDFLASATSQSLLGIIVSGSMLREDWPSAQEEIQCLQEHAPAARRMVTILIENVTLPPLLRLGEWFDFRNEKYFQENLSGLMHFLEEDIAPRKNVPLPKNSVQRISTKESSSFGGTSSSGVCSAKERVVSNLFPVAELPRIVFSAETQIQSESELAEICDGAGPLPILLKGTTLYTLEPFSRDSALAPAITDWDTFKSEDFTTWFSRPDRAAWAIELLNNLFRQHAWKRGLRWDKSTDQYYFPRTKPKSIWWEMNGRTISREITAPHLGWIELGNQVRAEIQYGWKHQSIRAGYVQAGGNLFLRLEPSWLLTELDGKTPATTQPVGPVFSGSDLQERNGQVLRSLRFWSAVLAKGHHEIRINTGQAPIRIKLTPLSGFTQFGMTGDQMNYDQMMIAEMEDDLLMPALGPLEQESIFNHEEGLSSETLGRSRNE